MKKIDVTHAVTLAAAICVLPACLSGQDDATSADELASASDAKSSAPDSPHKHPGTDSTTPADECVDDELARARAATEKYKDVAAALADGFVQAGECVSVPGLGTMGIHFLNFARLQDPLSIEEPEGLLYLPENGGLRLIGIEYLQLIVIDGVPYMGCGVENETCPPENAPPNPVLFDAPFAGPMAGHAEGMPWHFDLHVWLYEHNPAGLFAPFNPALECPADCDPSH